MTQKLASGRFKQFIAEFEGLLDSISSEREILSGGSQILAGLVSRDDWLEQPFTRPHPERYTQYLLHLDPQERFSVVSFVWGPGQKTPVHDHTVWGLIGVLRGAELSQSFRWSDGALLPSDHRHRLEPGDVEAVSPTIGDIHQVSNALDDRVSISIHVYGGDIGRISRHTYAPDGSTKLFVSGYTAVEP